MISEAHNCMSMSIIISGTVTHCVEMEIHWTFFHHSIYFGLKYAAECMRFLCCCIFFAALFVSLNFAEKITHLLSIHVIHLLSLSLVQSINCFDCAPIDSVPGADAVLHTLATIHHVIYTIYIHAAARSYVNTPEWYTTVYIL